MGLGFGGLALSGMHVDLTARFRSLSSPFGADVVYLSIGTVLVMSAPEGANMEEG